MSLNSFFSSLLPKEDKFFPKFQQMSARIVTGADLFTEMVSATNHDKQVELYTKIKSIETECDNMMVNIFDDLDDSFVAPFDREDMHQLVNDVDDVMDLINDSAKRLMLYQPKLMPQKAMHLAEIILESAKAISEVFIALPNMKKNPDSIVAQCQKIHELENEGDDVYDNFVKELFETEPDVKELIKIKEIMQCMEEATDRANHVGKAIQIIMMKYA
ncbi:MAG: DUF47 family protein [Paludibacteraceae bacterium]|nr:DUF47 family protein [Paludibacteraceae bacterium]